MATDVAGIGSKVLDEVFQGIRKAAESSMKMQQEVLHQWTSTWPFPTPQSVWIDKVRGFQKQWAHTVSDIARKHRDVIEKQYQSALESLEAALHVSESTNPEEYRRRTEQLCRKTLDCMRDISESNLHEFQDAVSKLTELATKTAT